MSARSTSRVLALAATLLMTACGGSRPAAATITSPPQPTIAADASSTVAAWRSSTAFTPRTADESGAPLNYYEYLPSGYPDGEARPLLIFLHGFGGSGDGTEESVQNLFETGIPMLIANDRWPQDRPFVVLAPQHDLPPGEPPEDYAPCDEAQFVASCVMDVQHRLGNPADASPYMTPAEIKDFISFAVATYEIDPQRVYLTGLSAGAYGAYEYAAQYGASQVAAMAVMSGDARGAWETAGCDLGQLPIWAFEGDADDVVKPADAIDPIKTLIDCPAPPRQDVELTVYPGADHDSWSRTYDLSAGNDIYAWLLNYTRP